MAALIFCKGNHRVHVETAPCSDWPRQKQKCPLPLLYYQSDRLIVSLYHQNILNLKPMHWGKIVVKVNIHLVL